MGTHPVGIGSLMKKRLRLSECRSRRSEYSNVGIGSLMKKRLRPGLAETAGLAGMDGGNRFADEEAIETLMPSATVFRSLCGNRFADEEAIETDALHIRGEKCGCKVGIGSLMKKRLRLKCVVTNTLGVSPVGIGSLMKKRLRRAGAVVGAAGTASLWE